MHPPLVHSALVYIDVPWGDAYTSEDGLNKMLTRPIRNELGIFVCFRDRSFRTLRLPRSTATRLGNKVYHGLRESSHGLFVECFSDSTSVPQPHLAPSLKGQIGLACLYYAFERGWGSLNPPTREGWNHLVVYQAEGLVRADAIRKCHPVNRRNGTWENEDVMTQVF